MKFFLLFLLLFNITLGSIVGHKLEYTLEKNGNWKSIKEDLFLPTTQSEQLLTSRVPLAGGKLNLASWHGYHSISSNTSYDLGGANFKFNLSENGYIVFLFGRNEGIRLSLNPLYPSAKITFTPEGKFLTKEITFTKIYSGFDYITSLVFSDGKVHGMLNNKNFLAVKANNRGPIGFKGSQTKSTIDNLSWYTDRDFRYDNFEGFPSPMTILFCCLIFAIIFFTVKKRENLFVLLTTTSLLLTAFFLFDRYYISHLYPSDRPFLIDEKGDSLPEERPEDQYFMSLYEGVLKKQLKRSSKGKKIFVVGGSQTYGEGILKEGDDFVSVLEKLSGDSSYSFYNFGVPGARAKTIHWFLENHLLKENPDFVLINTGNNDRIPEELGESLEKIILLLKSRGIKLLISLEPNEYENLDVLYDMSESHDIMKRIAKKYEIPTIEPYEDLRDPILIDSGFLWWDYVHMTSYGYELLGKFIWRKLMGHLP